MHVPFLFCAISVLGQAVRGAPALSPRATANGLIRGMWVWNSASILQSPTQINDLIAGATAANVTDLYFYMAPTSYATVTTQLQTFISQASRAQLRVWGLDGARTYFADAQGPKLFYDGINNLIAYNNVSSASQRFYGFQADIEPPDSHADGQNLTSFHNSIPDSQLSTAAGSGVWQPTAAQDREMLMRNWLNIHETARNTLHAASLRFGAAMPFWTSTYYGEEVRVSYPDSTSLRQCVMKYMMHYVDEYVIMSYNTDPVNAAGRVETQAAYASTLPVGSMPNVFAAVEVTTGVGIYISYGDTPGKASKQVVAADMRNITAALTKYPAFAGVGLHMWQAWQALPA
ncbi:hypothetical protein LTR50_004738 [Elasticomyces elasticus]|nr:hypothetical protein LTR50_004738 [Elasticomyces elasticus]